MRNLVFDILLASGLVAVGYIYLKEGWSFLHDQPVPAAAGYVCIGAGLIYLIFSLRKKNRKK